MKWTSVSGVCEVYDTGKVVLLYRYHSAGPMTVVIPDHMLLGDEIVPIDGVDDRVRKLQSRLDLLQAWYDKQTGRITELEAKLAEANLALAKTKKLLEKEKQRNADGGLSASDATGGELGVAQDGQGWLSRIIGLKEG